jgi:hypothetical protein
MRHPECDEHQFRTADHEDGNDHYRGHFPESPHTGSRRQGRHVGEADSISPGLGPEIGNGVTVAHVTLIQLRARRLANRTRGRRTRPAIKTPLERAPQSGRGPAMMRQARSAGIKFADKL